MKGKIGGSIVAPYLPFDEKKQLKEKVLGKYLDFIVKAGPDALYCLGSVEEFAAMTLEQRKRVADTIVGLVAKRVPVVMQRTGYDAVFFSEVSERPVYLYLNDGWAELRDANHLGSQDSYDVEDWVKDRLGDDVGRGRASA